MLCGFIFKVWVFSTGLLFCIKSYPLQRKPGSNLRKSNHESFLNSTASSLKIVESTIETFNEVSLPTFPYCDLCGENGLWTVRDRGGLKVFANVNDSPFSLHTNSSALSFLPSWCHDVVIVQVDSRNPTNEAMNENLKFPEYDYTYTTKTYFNKQGGKKVLDVSFLINSAYAFLHGYGYLFIELDQAIPRRYFSWGKIDALRYASNQCPNAIIICLDSDAYIRSLTSKVLNNLGGYDIAMPMECQWMGWLVSNPQYRNCYNMDQHNEIFQTSDQWSPDAHAGVI